MPETEQVAVICTDCGHTAIVPDDIHVMSCTQCGGLNVPIEEALRDEREARAYVEVELAECKTELAIARTRLPGR